LQFLRLLAEEAKKALSDQENFNKIININNQSFDLKLSRAEFELGITPIVEKTMVSCKQAMLMPNYLPPILMK
jgi:molecular chaperone DnaK (HSP70)